MSESDILTIIDSIVEACRLAGVDPEPHLNLMAQQRENSALSDAIEHEIELRAIRGNQRT